MARYLQPDPCSGAVMAIRDSDSDGLPDKMETFAEDLTLPMGLAFHDQHLYVSGGNHIYRIAESSAVDIIVDDLPSGSGFWTGGITVGARQPPIPCARRAMRQLRI